MVSTARAVAARGASGNPSPSREMLEITSQERMALIVLAVLLTTGAVARHAVYRADATDRLQYTFEASDTLHTGAGSALRRGVETAVERQRTRDTPLADGERIDPNQASADELARLPRVGPALAERIVARRREMGSFRSVEDLRAVSGIGPAVLEAIAPHLDLARPSAGGGRTRRGGRVDLNRASAEELQSLPGIGPAIAERIIAHRNTNGRFRTFADLEEVSGVGPRLRERLESSASLGP